MGLEIKVDGAADVAQAIARLAGEGFPCAVLMVDGQLVMPRAPLPAAWREVRLKTPAGMVTLARKADGIAVLVFGNADAPLVAAQERVAAALGHKT